MLLWLLVLIISTHGVYQLSNDAECFACKMISTRIYNRMYDVDDKKTMKIGGRMKRGQMGAGEFIKYAGSETHMNDIFDGICLSTFEDYDQVIEVEGKDQIVKSGKVFEGMSRSKRREMGLGMEELEVNDAVLDSCYSLLESTEDALPAYMQEYYENMKDVQLWYQLCNVFSDRCDEDRKPPKRRKKRARRKKKKTEL